MSEEGSAAAGPAPAPPAPPPLDAEGGTALQGAAEASAPAAPVPAEAPPAAPRTTPAADRRAKRRAARAARAGKQPSGLGGRLFLLALAFAAVVAAFELSGKPIPVPVFLVAEVENRLNAPVRAALPGTALSVGTIEVEVGDDFVPHLILGDVTLTKQDGPVLLTLPDTELTVDPAALLSGQIRPQSLVISGATVRVRRDAEGRFDFAFGAGQGPKIDSLAAVFAALDRTFANPALARFAHVEANALSLTFEDAISGRTWSIGDGRFVFENRERAFALELGLSLLGQGGVAAEADLTAIKEKGRDTARITAAVNRVAAADMAAQTPVLGFLAALDAPISGQIVASLDKDGVEGLDGRLDIGAGAVRPSDQSEPLAFDRAALSVGYSPKDGRVRLGEIAVESKSLRLSAQGQAYLVDAEGKVLTGPLDGRRPSAFLGQVSFDRVQVDPAGVFAAPVEFSQGALELKLAFAPFRLDLGQFSLAEGEQRLTLSGHVEALQDGRLATALDLKVNRMDRDRLLALWPPKLVTPTRNWINENLTQASLTGITGALRQVTGETPNFELDWGFDRTVFKFMKQMPPVTRADGYATIQNRVYTVVMDSGVIEAPQGGTLDVSGSVMQVPDIMAKPATGVFRVKSRGSLTATLAMLDNDPFHFLSKAGRPVDLGEGQVEVSADISLPLIGRVMPWQVTYDARGLIRDFRSDQIVRGKTVTAPRLEVRADPKGMTIAGPGKVGAVPVDVVYTQPFGPEAPPAVVEGTVELGPVAVKEFRIGLPAGSVKGAETGKLRIVLVKDQPPELTLTSDVRGLTLSLPDIGWRKPAGTAGQLDVSAVLATPMRVPALSLTAPGLSASGSVTLDAAGGLEVMNLPEVKIADWFAGGVDIRGRGAGEPVGLDVTSGWFDLRRFPDDRGGGDGSSAGGGPLTARLDKLQVTDSIALTRFTGDFTLAGGFSGRFQGLVNGKAPVAGEVAPAEHGTAVRVTSEDAGAVARATGIYTSAYGGTLEMTLIPRKGGDSYSGALTTGPLRVRYDSLIADLLNAISVVGLLQQLNGPGIAFESAEARFVIEPGRIVLQRGSAIGASIGISLAGTYDTEADLLDMQGVASPVYLLNGLGSFLTRKGEGLFGFNYDLRGPASDPVLSVNPLSILTPGMFRELFRVPPPPEAAAPSQ